jgi:hypothetical protein
MMSDHVDDRPARAGIRPAGRPSTARLAAVGLWVRAALRLPVLLFVGFYVFQGIEIDQRSRDFPDGAFDVWKYYAVSEADNFLLVPVGGLADAAIGWTSMASWLVAYTALTVGYLLVGLRVWHSRRFSRGGYRATIGYLVFSFCVHLLTLAIVVPGAVHAVRTGENAPVHPYTGMSMVHAYEWLLLPWSLALAAITGAVVALLRTGSARARLGIAAPQGRTT